jgi:poly(hydroxyalkanoate) depolymerase family esterase
MNPAFQQLMTQATQLTRAGNLRGALGAIRAALARHPPADQPRDDADVVDVEAREIDVEAAATAPPSSAAGRFIAGRHGTASGTREYKLFIPPGRESESRPLIVMLHGCTQNPDDFALGTRMNEAALERGLLVLYPAQSASASPSRCWNWFKHNHQQRDRGEPAILAGMTLDVMRTHGIDRRRVYVAGLSAGGAMAAILGDAYPELFAAVGVHSGLPVGSASDVATAFAAMKGGAVAAVSPTKARRPTIVFHGDQDNTVHPVNAERVVAAHAASAAAEVDRMAGGNGRAHTRHVYRDGDGRPIAEHWVVHGCGHAWSGGSAAGSFTDTKGPSATDEMLRFFADHALPDAH